jgi:hypothetical protein
MVSSGHGGIVGEAGGGVVGEVAGGGVRESLRKTLSLREGGPLYIPYFSELEACRLTVAEAGGSCWNLVCVLFPHL